MNVGLMTEAVMFFSDDGDVKEMLYPEFEALLDCVVAIPEFTAKPIASLFIEVNPQLQAVACVFFYLKFDDTGFADKEWNMPLRHLADTGGPGPDMGAGQIKLSCRSRCSVSWHQRDMWDPDVDGSPNTFERVAQLLARNRLGLPYDPPARKKVSRSPRSVPAPAVQPGVDLAALEERSRQRQALALEQQKVALLDEQKLRIANLKAEAMEHVEKLHLHYRSEMDAQSVTRQEMERELEGERLKNRRFKDDLDQQAAEQQGERERLQRDIERGHDVEQGKLLDLQQKFDSEMAARLESSSSELKEMLEMREVELFYRDEQISNLREEVALLRQERLTMLNDSGDRVLQRLSQAGINFVAYQPGSDYLSVPLAEMSVYLDSPVAFAAEKNSVDLELYEKWLAHYQLPVCSCDLGDGALCGEPILKVERPGRFIPGESDRCRQHGVSGSAISSLLSMKQPYSV